MEKEYLDVNTSDTLETPSATVKVNIVVVSVQTGR